MTHFLGCHPKKVSSHFDYRGIKYTAVKVIVELTYEITVNNELFRLDHVDQAQTKTFLKHPWDQICWECRELACVESKKKK